MRHRIGLATTCLHISAFLYVIIGFLLFFLIASQDKTGFELPMAISMLLFCLALAIGIEFVVYGLRRRKFWAWVTGLCIFGIYSASLFLPLGALGLWGLLDSGSQAEFGMGNTSRGAETSDESWKP